MTSFIIPAHDEDRLLGRTLDALDDAAHRRQLRAHSEARLPVSKRAMAVAPSSEASVITP